ncbi:MAG: hypothetical protein M1495_04255 [Bacteroidetes bacterium]|nr:hypothetical protein [Bacteroidota bacterium]
MKLNNRSIKTFAVSFFVFYSFFTVFAVFHNHNINLPGKDSVVIHQKESSNNAFDPFMDGNSICRLYQFGAVKVLPEIGKETNFALLRIETRIQIKYVNQYSANISSDLSLRAPPAVA